MKVVIFDMDGTVIDSSKAIGKTIKKIRENMGFDPLDEKFILEAINEPGRDLPYEFYGIKKPSHSLKEGFENEFALNYDLYAKVFPDIPKILKKLKENGCMVALASNAPEKTLIEILRKNEILEYFDSVVGVNDKIPQKPDPTMLKVVCENLKTSRAVFVGDSQKDESAAINAEMPYIHVNWGFGKSVNDLSYKVDDIDGLWEVVEKFI